MLAYFIIGVSLLIALIVGSQSLATADPKKILKGLRVAGVIFFALLAGFFALTGRFAYAMPLALAALFFLRNKPLFGSSHPSEGQKSDVKTAWLRATLNHDSGEMDATILQGQFKDRELSSLTRAELGEFHQEAIGDEQTIAILESFISRKFGEDSSEDNTSQSEGSRRTSSDSGPMTRKEAFEILELESNATVAEIKSAHRRLMKKFHPDHNGSDYMAAKLNEAKDLLLKT
ncbi:DnaJ domain-containing protein [uncultured Sneathiella sp.]|uniref:DnaJ domain-containing protein n=1 Tax=uncultured Sneathiella sp. TaxID=879315 RepID=UPI0030EC0037|tara:strand:+ start:128839 stop:129534 length:696 start_codon:yes stop_codon:yes gene_type:complete